MQQREPSCEEPGGGGDVARLIRDVLDSPRMTRNARALLKQIFWSVVLPVVLATVVVSLCTTILIVAHAGAISTGAGALITGTGAGAAVHSIRKQMHGRKKRGKRLPPGNASGRADDRGVHLLSP